MAIHLQSLFLIHIKIFVYFNSMLSTTIIYGMYHQNDIVETDVASLVKLTFTTYSLSVTFEAVSTKLLFLKCKKKSTTDSVTFS